MRFQQTSKGKARRLAPRSLPVCGRRCTRRCARSIEWKPGRVTVFKCIDAGTLTIVYEETGHPGGRPVVLLHGSPSWATICGMAVGTMVASIAIMNIAAMTEATTRGRRNVGTWGMLAG